MRINFEVTQEDINEGDRVNGGSCPIALALFRATATMPVSNLWVEEGRTILYGPDPVESPLTAVNTKKMRNFIRKFDTYKPVKPDRFSLVVPNVPTE